MIIRSRSIWTVASGLFVLVIVIVVGGPPLAAAGNGRVGSATCEGCHEEVVVAFRSSVHWKSDPQGSCEGCHGPGEVHAEEADPSLILRFGEDTSTTERNGACLECHGRDRRVRHYASGEHGLSALACVRCHSPHGSTRRSLLVRETPDLCYECHPTARAEFALNERHPVNQGGIECQDCHNPHRRSDRTVLGGFRQEMCLRCHTEHRGPWVFEHEAVAVEGCGSCHVPHGSVNRHLLTYQRAGDLCLQCHPEQPFFHDLTDASGARTSSFNVCTNCHVAIHGSNNDALFLN